MNELTMGPLSARRKIENETTVFRCGVVTCREVIAWSDEVDVHNAIMIPSKYKQNALGIFIATRRAASRSASEREAAKRQDTPHDFLRKVITAKAENLEGAQTALQVAKDANDRRTARAGTIRFYDDIDTTIIRCAQCGRLSKISR